MKNKFNDFFTVFILFTGCVLGEVLIVEFLNLLFDLNLYILQWVFLIFIIVFDPIICKHIYFKYIKK